jgi:predicted permease
MIRALKSGLNRLFHKQAVERDLADEVEHYVEMAAREHMRAGASREDALRAARIEVGGVEAVKETARSGGWEAGVESFVQDARYALRGIRRAPAFSAVAIGTLALGIGASTALFSVADEVFLKSLPVRDPAELVLFGWHSGPTWIGGTIAGMGIDSKTGQLQSTAFQKLAYERFRDHTTTLASVFAFASMSDVATPDSESVLVQPVSGNYFAALGVGAAAGRTLTVADDQTSAAAVAVISHRYWVRRFGGDTSVIHKTITLANVSFAIVGVSARGFTGTGQLGSAPDVSIPLARIDDVEGLAFKGAINRSSLWPLRVMGRLKAGVTYAQVERDLQDDLQSAALDGWNSMPRRRANPSMPQLEATPGGKGMVEERRALARVVQIISAVVALVLLIVCTNLANLLLARSTARRREIALRAAIGARRGRLVRQFLTETGMLALAGGALGVLLANWGKQLFLVLINRASPTFVLDPQLDTRVLGFAVVVAGLTAISVGLLPALRSTRLDLAAAIKDGDARGGRSRSLMSRSLVVAQVAMSVVLLVGAGLFLRTVNNLRSANVGFNAKHVLLVDVRLPRMAPGNSADVVAMWDRLVERVGGIPGVSGVAYSQYPLLSGDRAMPFLYVPEREKQPGEDPTVYVQAVHSAFFSVMQMPLAGGRALEPADRAGARVLVVNEALARQFFGTTSVLGKRIGTTKEQTRPVVPDSELYQIVGVVRDAKFASVRQPVPPSAYTPLTSDIRELTLEIRSTLAEPALTAAVRSAGREVLPGARIDTFRSQESAAAESFADERNFAVLTSLFGALALTLASLGLYGLISYRVAQRTQELGVRVALGASRGSLVRMVVGDTLVLAALGVAAGVAGALVATRLIAGFLYGVPAIDVVSLGAAAVTMLGVSAIAGYVPGRRAARIDPLVALRHE